MLKELSDLIDKAEQAKTPSERLKVSCQLSGLAHRLGLFEKLGENEIELGTLKDYILSRRSKMTWNYRVIKQEQPEGTAFAIYEVYYDEQDNIQFISNDPQNPFGETIEELRGDLEYMLQALDKPVLDMEEVLKSLEANGCMDHAKV